VIKSPGLPVEPITLEDLQSFNAPSLSRNPKVTYVLNQMELMEEAELGMETFRTMQDAYGLPAPEISYKAPYLSVVFPREVSAVRRISSILN
jgi:ATP-dependent DNA helicase RecG